ncbi:hypothetical protein INE81_01932 [Bacteroides salyersiae]|nr:hypothetical protein INE81_01932 [Bacteroides salyersiae]
MNIWYTENIGNSEILPMYVAYFDDPYFNCGKSLFASTKSTFEKRISTISPLP